MSATHTANGVAPLGSLEKRGKTSFRTYLKKYWFVYLLVLPGLCFMILFNFGPMYGIQLAFKDYSIKAGVWGSPWVGFKHFQEMFVDVVFWNAFKNTIIINIYSLLFGFTFNVFLALMINEIRVKFLKSTVQTLVYLPYFLSWVIFSGLVIIFLNTSNSGGIFNSIIVSLGGSEIDFLKRPELFRGILVITNIIKTAGYSTIIYLAAISGVSPTLYESAQMDGANRFHLLWHITLPRILPSIAVMFVLQISSLFISNFDQVYNLYNAYVLSTGDVLSTYIYRNSLGGGGNFEISTAMNFILNAFGMIIVIITNRFVKKLDVMGIF